MALTYVGRVRLLCSLTQVLGLR